MKSCGGDFKRATTTTLLSCLSLVWLFFLVREAPAQSVKNDEELKRVASWMTGDFDTFAQVEQDETNDTAYKHTRALVHVAPINIAGLDDGLSFYVENQVSGDRPRPYRQRVYVLKRDAAGKIVIEMYKIKGEKELVNAYKKTELLKDLTADRLIRETGCEMTFVKAKENLYKGVAGEERTCPSDWRGATHMTSHVALSPHEWINLDQGFDDAGNPKWGPPPGVVGHIFIRRKPCVGELPIDNR